MVVGSVAQREAPRIMVDQSFEAILEGVVAKHEDRGWRTVFGRASSGMMSVIGIRRGPKMAGSVASAAAARAAYEDLPDEDDFSDFDPPEPASAKAPEPPRWPAGRTPDSKPSESTQGSAAEAKAAYAKDRDDAPPPPPPGAPSTDPYEIARELNILTASSVKDLLDARRNFARKNHPDRMPMLYRAQATIRMQVANRLVDDAVARMSGQGRR